MIEQHLREWLIADPAIYAEVGDRIHPQFIPEATPLPAIAMSMISDQAYVGMTGPTPLRSPRIQLSIVAMTQPKVSQISELLKARINAWNATYADMQVSSTFAEGGVYLALDYYNPKRFGMIIEAFVSWAPV